MSWLRRWDRWSRRAGAAVVFAGVVLVVAAVGALRITPPTTGGGSAPAFDPLPPAPDTSPDATPGAVTAAVEADPFRPDRSPPDRRYVRPARRGGGDADTRPAGGRDLRLVGTTTFSDRGGLAAFRLAGGESRLVRAGNRIRGLRVVRVEEGRVVLAGADTTMTLSVEPPGQKGRHR